MYLLAELTPMGEIRVPLLTASHRDLNRLENVPGTCEKIGFTDFGTMYFQ